MQVFQMEHLIHWATSLKTVGLSPNMAKIGLGNIPREVPLKTVPAESKLQLVGADKIARSLWERHQTGHWEIAGPNITEPF